MNGTTKKITIKFSTEALAVLNNFQARYPNRSITEFTNAAVLYLAKQSRVGGLNANCQPLIDTVLLEDLMREIVAEEVAAIYAEEDKDIRPRLVLV